MRSISRIGELREALVPERARSEVGLVPTMGAFHPGHLSLFDAARQAGGLVAVSIFTNPAQFGADEDLARYPRDLERDARLAEEAGVDVLFVPDADEIYPPGFDTWVDVGELGSLLEGAARPDHFRGVATVCLKLFEIVRPARAYFGQKDAQQAAVVRQMVRDLDLDLQLDVRPTVRDDDGLAWSSRNAYLSLEERTQALALPAALLAGQEAYRRGEDPVPVARRRLGALTADYLSVADFGGPTLVAAVRVGTTRLIDNVRLDEEKSA
ncbi:MAG: pantoate--beta-alanine ligase [Candidatus Limnocylindria bacterium]